MDGTPREVILELYRIWGEQGVKAALRHVSPDIEWVEPAEALGREDRRGVTGALENYESWVGTYEDYGGEIEAIEDDGDRVLVKFVQRGTPRGGSKPVEESVYQVWTVRDGLAVRMQMFFDPGEARAALQGGSYS
jgi:ketosteroid isomerase-like protein